MKSIVTHMTVGTADFKKSKEFYSKLLSELGYAIEFEADGLVGFGWSKDAEANFWIAAGAPISKGLHFCFTASRREEVDRFYKKALELGATDNGEPGLREYRPDYYAAYVIDHDGYRIEALCLESLQ